MPRKKKGHYVQSMRRVVDAKTRQCKERGDGWYGFYQLWETHHEAAEDVAVFARKAVSNPAEVPSMVRSYFRILAGAVRKEIVTKKMDCAAAKTSVADRALRQGVQAKDIVKTKACLAAAALLKDVDDTWVVDEAKTTTQDCVVGGIVLWDKHVTTAQTAARDAVDTGTKPDEIPGLFADFFCSFMTTACTQRKGKRKPWGVTAQHLTAGLLAKGLPGDPVKAEAFTAAALLLEAIPDAAAPGSSATSRAPSSRAGTTTHHNTAASLPAAMAVGVARTRKSGACTPAFGTPSPKATPALGTRPAATASTSGYGPSPQRRGKRLERPMTSPPGHATRSSPLSSGRQHAGKANTTAASSTAAVPAPTDITSSSPWGKQQHGCRPGLPVDDPASPARTNRSTNTAGVDGVDGLCTPASLTTESASEVSAGGAGAMAQQPASSGGSGCMATPPEYSSILSEGDVGAKRTAPGAAAVQAEGAGGVGGCLAGKTLRSNRHPRCLDAVGGGGSSSPYAGIPGGGSSSAMAGPSPAMAMEAAGIGAGVAASSTPFSTDQGVGALWSGSSGLLGSAAAPAMAADVGGAWNSMLANMAYSCPPPLSVQAAGGSPLPMPFPSAPRMAPMAPAAATGAELSDLTFFSAFPPSVNASGPPGNSGLYGGVKQPNVPVAREATPAEVVAAAAAATAAAVAVAVAEATATAAPVTSSPMNAGASVEGSGATVAALPATFNPSEVFYAPTPPISSGLETSGNGSGSDVHTGSGLDSIGGSSNVGPTDDCNDGSSSAGGKRKATGSDGATENHPCDGGPRKKARSG